MDISTRPNPDPIASPTHFIFRCPPRPRPLRTLRPLKTFAFSSTRRLRLLLCRRGAARGDPPGESIKRKSPGLLVTATEALSKPFYIAPPGKNSEPTQRGQALLSANSGAVPAPYWTSHVPVTSRGKPALAGDGEAVPEPAEFSAAGLWERGEGGRWTLVEPWGAEIELFTWHIGGNA